MEFVKDRMRGARILPQTRALNFLYMKDNHSYTLRFVPYKDSFVGESDIYSFAYHRVDNAVNVRCRGKSCIFV